MSEVMWSCHLLLERVIANILTPAKTGGKEGIAQQERDSQGRVTESIQQEKGLVDGRLIKTVLYSPSTTVQDILNV